MPDDPKFFEGAQALAQSLSQWSLLIFGGSLAIILGTSYRRPATRRMRLIYLLFLPAWSLLAFSIYEGFEVQGSYVAYLLAARGKGAAVNAKIGDIAIDINTATTLQTRGLESALVLLGVWIVVYTLWWIMARDTGAPEK